MIRASAPTRIDLAGGTLDIWPLYLFHKHPQTVNAAISLRAEAEVIPRDDGRLRLESIDGGESIDVGEWRDLATEKRLPLLSKLAYFFRAANLTLRTRGRSPAGAGIAGSSALNVAVCGALAHWGGHRLDGEKLLAIAQDIEAQVIRVPTGLQDYRPAYYGGVAAVELEPGGVRRVPIAIDISELERRLVLAYTGAPRNSGTNNWEITKRHIDGDARVFECFDRISEATARLREGLADSNWPAVTEAIDAEWSARKQLSPGVTTSGIDALISAAVAAGAGAAKVCGAGGGGCLFCVADPTDVPRVKAALAASGAAVLEFTIERQGLIVTSSTG
jgi:D-glycero-alpha-D-manno-heptose-7-phosphate kinase